MPNNLSPFFQSRENRTAPFPQDARTKFEALEKQASDAGDPEFGDRQFVSLWLADRTGLPRDEIKANFEEVSGRYFGKGTTAAQSWDKISSLYQPPADGEEKTPVSGSDVLPPDYFESKGYPRSGPEAAYYKFDQSVRAIGSGFSDIPVTTMGGFYSQVSTLIGEPTLRDPMTDPKYAELASKIAAIENPYSTAAIYPEAGSYYGPSDSDYAMIDKLKAEQKALRDIHAAENRDEIRKWQENGMATMSAEYRKKSEFWYQLSDELDAQYGVDPRFAETTIGQFMKSAGSMPATMAMAGLGLIGGVTLESMFFGQVEKERMAIEGASYNPETAVWENLASAVPQMVIEGAFGVERILTAALKNTARKSGKIAFGDFVRNFAKKGLMSGIEEGLTEPSQGFWNDYMASITYDEKRELFTEDAIKVRLLESFFGFTMGAMMGSGISALNTLDMNKSIGRASTYLTSKQGDPLNEFDFKMMRSVKTDDEIRAMAPDPKTGDLMLRAANGDGAALKAYNKQVYDNLFVKTDGVQMDGDETSTTTGGFLGNVLGQPVFKDSHGNYFELDLSNPEHATFVEHFKRIISDQIRISAREDTIRMFQKRLGEGSTIEVHDAVEKVVGDFVKDGQIDMAGALERIAVARDVNNAALDDVDVLSVRVLGTNVVEYRDNMFRDIIKLWKGSNAFTVVEEVAEGYIKKRMEVGDLDEAELIDWRAKYEAATGEKTTTKGRISNIEWFSSRVVDYAVANRKAAGMPKSWGAVLRTLGDHLKLVLKQSAKMSKLQRDGLLDAGFEAALKGALGMTTVEQAQTEVNDARAQRQAELDALFGEGAARKIDEAERESPEGAQRLNYDLRKREAESKAVYGIRAKLSAQAQRLMEDMGYGDISFSMQAGQPGASGAASANGTGRNTGTDGKDGHRILGTQALAGAPQIQGASGPDQSLVSAAESYARSAGIDLKRQSEFVEVDLDLAQRIAEAYENMEHDPKDPRVREAYQNLIKQTVAQYRALEDAGYQFYFFDENGVDPYADSKGGFANPWNAMRDLRANKRMAVFPTDSGFGSSDNELIGNPLLEVTDVEWAFGSPDGPKRKVTANDLFRAVHDAFGHGIEGAGFRARGEENAWQAHSRLFTGSALGALTTETRGQNSWLNFGPHGETNRTAQVQDTVFADQKTGLLPEFAWTEGQAGTMGEGTPDITFSMAQTDTPAFKAWFGDSKVVDKDGNPLVVYHGAAKGFTQFNPKKIGARDPGFFGAGFYFTPDEEAAWSYASSASEADRTDEGKAKVIPAFISLQKPFIWDMEAGDGAKATRQALQGMGIERSSVRGDSSALSTQNERRKFNDGMRVGGHDGVIVRDEDGIREVVAFSPTQIKSAIGNRGTFDPGNPDITFSMLMTVAPLRVDNLEGMSKADMMKRAASAKFVHLQQVTQDIAKAYGIKIISSYPAIGGWHDGQSVSLEVPNVIEIDTDDADIAEEIAALIGASAPELQNAAMILKYDENGEDDVVTFLAKNGAAAQRIADAFIQSGQKGFSYDPGTRKFTIVLKGVTDQGILDVALFIEEQRDSGNIGLSEIGQWEPGSATFLNEEAYQRYVAQGRTRASTTQGSQREALDEVISRAERRLKRYAAAGKISRKAGRVIKKLPIPYESAKAIEETSISLKFENIRDFGLWLDSRFEASHGFRSFPVKGKEGISAAGDALAYDIIDGLTGDGSGMGWYDERVQETMHELMKMFPEFVNDANAMTVYIGALAITSQGYNVTENFKNARKVYESYKKTGKLPTDMKWAQSSPAINNNLKLLQTIIDEYGLDGLREFMDQEVLGSQLKEMFGKAPSGVTLKDVVRGNRVLGPKIGSFFNNLRGRFDTITMDLWYTRTMHRYLGESVIPLDTPKIQKTLRKFRAELKKVGTRKYGVDLEAAMKDDESAVKAGVRIFTRWGQGKNEYTEKTYFKFPDGSKIEKLARTIKHTTMMKGAPQNKAHREWFAAVVLDAKQKLHDLKFKLTEADMQAIVWYREKNLFALNGLANSASKPADYVDAVMVARRDKEASEPTFSMAGSAKNPGDDDIGLAYELSGVPISEKQALDAQFERIRAKSLAASADLIKRMQDNVPLPVRVQRVVRSHEASLMARAAVPISGRLQRLARPLAQRLRRFEFDSVQAIKRDMDRIQPFMDAFSNMKPQDARLLDLALKNGDVETFTPILKAYGMEESYSAVVDVLSSARDRGIAAGYEVGYIKDYFPRKVLDLSGLQAHYYGDPLEGVIDAALKEAQMKAQAEGRALTRDEKLIVVNRALQGNVRKPSGPGNFKGRKTDVVSVDADQFYADSIQALIGYIESTNNAIEKRRFFGKFAVSMKDVTGVEGVSNTLALDASIGGLVNGLIEEGMLSRESQDEVISILEARFNQGIANEFIKNFKSLAYLTSMGQVTSAITQFGDLAFSMYETGVFNTLVAAGEAFTRDSKITRGSLGIENVAEEFKDVTKMAKLVNGVFKATGLHYIDMVGKETLVNAKFKSMQQEVQNNKLSRKTQQLLDTSFTPEQAAQVLTDLKAGKQTPDTLFAVYSVLSDYQPISLSEYPEAYLRHPNGRIFYMLKTFTLKQIEAFRREGLDLIVKGSPAQKMEGMGRLMKLAGLFYLINIPVDWIKDFIMGRDPQMDDLMVDNLFKLMGFSRWHVWNFRYRQNPLETAALLVLPAAPFIQYPFMDMQDAIKQISKGEDIEPGQFNTWRILPIVGSPFYWHFGGGATKIEKRREEREGPPTRIR
jgi:hypothetical protein